MTHQELSANADPRLVETSMSFPLASFPLESSYLPLRAYPNAICVAENGLLDFQAQVRSIESRLAAEDCAIEAQIANAELRNEQQRKAEKLALQQAEEYQALLLALQLAQDMLSRQRSNLARLKNEFKVLQLESQLSISEG